MPRTSGPGRWLAPGLPRIGAWRRPGRWLAWLQAEWLLVLFALLTLALAWIDPQPPSHYRRWLQVPTLAGLAGLLIAIQGIRDSGLVQRAAAALVLRAHTLRGLGVRLVLASGGLSMVLTNDASLFLIVPLTLALGTISNLPVLRMVVLEALAVNAGSALSPIGNPQNLLLWQHAQLSFGAFALAMLPVTAVSGALLLAWTWFGLPRGRVALAPDAVDGRVVAWPLAALSLVGLLAMVLLMEHHHALAGASALLLAFVLLARASLLRVDLLLLLTFAAVFLALGHMAQMPQAGTALGWIDPQRPLSLYLGGIVGAQMLSNVPATVLLLGHVPVARTMLLAVAVNVGGFGLVTGSLASLIALRLARQPHGLREFHRVSMPFLLLCAPLVYLAWRAAG